MAGHPSATVVACRDDARAQRIQHIFTTDSLRVYTNPDVVGCEIGGAVKNVIAIAAGIADGLGYGWNTKAALITAASPSSRDSESRSSALRSPSSDSRAMET